MTALRARMWAWIALLTTVVLEIIATLTLKASDGFTVLIPSVIAVLCYLGTLIALSRALTVIPTGIAYVIWTGAGTAGVAIFGIVLFGDHATVVTWLGIFLVIVGVCLINAPGRSRSHPDA